VEITDLWDHSLSSPSLNKIMSSFRTEVREIKGQLKRGQGRVGHGHVRPYRFP
jgi:hypothetical protein